MKPLEVLGYSKILEAWEKINVLTALRAAIDRNEFDAISLQKKYGFSRKDLEYVWEVFPELKVHRRPTPGAIASRIDELNKMLRDAMVGMLEGMELWIFPKGSCLICGVYLGMVEGSLRRDVLWSSVAILVPSVNNIFRYRLLSGEECVGIFGIGAYMCEFIPERAKDATTFTIPIHGVLMEMPMYERAISSKKRVVVPKYADYIREHLVRVPLSELAGSKFAPRFFGPAIRENSKAILGFLRSTRAFSVADVCIDGLTLLSAWRGAFNKLLVTESRFGKLSTDVIKGVPGVVGYEGVLDKLRELPMVHNTDAFVDSTRLLWLRLSVAGFSILEQFIGATR